MRSFLAPALLTLALGGLAPYLPTPSLAVLAARPTPAPVAQPIHRADDPVEQTYEEARAALIKYLGLSPEEAVYYLEHNDYYYQAIAYVALLEGKLPYHP